ncbi:MAG: glutamyl-tRNA reductase [Fusobacterium sp. JB021]|nr:glutamyl-tRNA reductase [Fusobacterium sp. JB021]MDP0507049.1 glutamyl-tRNA reductase [Fusobacterium sp. JB019]
MMNLKNIFVIGLSYNELDMVQRERFVLNNPEQIIEKLKKENKIIGYIKLFTCLRVEFYLEIKNIESIDEIIKQWGYDDKIYIYKGIEAVEYIFKISCGYYSVIKGEDQILSQIKKSYLSFLENKKTSKILNVIFNKAIEIGKRFRTKTKISHNALSLEALAYKVIKKYVKNIENKNILILGIGDLAKSILYVLVKQNIKDITITNRTKHKALEMKETFNVNVIDFEDKDKEVAKADIIISVTSAPHLVLKKKNIEKYLQKNKEYIFLDLAVPRDIEESIEEIEGITLINIDYVWSIYNINVKKRNEILENYEYLIKKQINNFKKWYDFYTKGENNVYEN